MTKPFTRPLRPPRARRKLPKSFKDLTPSKAFNPRTFFREMVWKAFLTPRVGQHKQPEFPKLKYGEVAITWNDNTPLVPYSHPRGHIDHTSESIEGPERRRATAARLRGG